MRSIIAKLLPLAFFAAVGVVAYSTNVPSHAQLNGREKGAGSGARNRGEWSAYGANKANTKYSPLDQISRQNVGSLRVAWRWTSPDMEVVKSTPGLVAGKFESTPIMVNGVLYTSTSLSQVAAIDPATGRTLWVYDPESWRNEPPPNLGFIHRGVAYWTDGKDERVFIGTGDAYLIALNAKTGQTIPGFGNNGRIDLTSGLRRPVERRYYYLTSPPVVCRNVLVIGSAVYDWHANDNMPPGDVRGFDVRTGKQLWTFHSIPQAGEFGNDTWLEGSWRTTGAANAWTILSADEELGYVYIPFSTPTNDYYGGHRPGDGLFGESLVCLEAKTGRRVWHFQTTHHGVRDYDLLKTGEHLWMTPMGEGPRKHPALSELSLPRLGWPLRGFPLVTRTLLLVAQEGGGAPTGKSQLIRYNSNLVQFDPALQAYDKRTGELIATVPLPNNAQGAPMTYAVGGTQYVVIAIGGANLPAELVALALPK